MSKRKLWVCTVTTEIYVLSEDRPDPLDVEDMARDIGMENKDFDARVVTANVLGWSPQALVYGPEDDVTLEAAIAEANS